MGHTHRYKFDFEKKYQVKSPSPEFRVPETGSDPPIGSDRDWGRDIRSSHLVNDTKLNTNFLKWKFIFTSSVTPYDFNFLVQLSFNFGLIRFKVFTTSSLLLIK